MVNLVRNKDFIKKNLIVKDNKVYAKEKTIIEFPKWYEEKELCQTDDVTKLYGIFAIIIGNNYSVSTIPTLVVTNPIVINEIEREDGTYKQFIYGKGDVILENTEVFKYNLLSYNYFDGFFIHSKVPWFVNYEDLMRINDNLDRYGGSKLGDNYLATELVTSFIARSSKNNMTFYRQESKFGLKYISMMNVFYSVFSTMSKLAGNYFQDSLTSALVQKDLSVSPLEEIYTR